MSKTTLKLSAAIALKLAAIVVAIAMTTSCKKSNKCYVCVDSIYRPENNTWEPVSHMDFCGTESEKNEMESKNSYKVYSDTSIVDRKRVCQ